MLQVGKNQKFLTFFRSNLSPTSFCAFSIRSLSLRSASSFASLSASSFYMEEVQKFGNTFIDVSSVYLP